MNQKKSNSPKDERVRNWTFIIYPESAPENWREILDQKFIPWVESPLHDKDLDPNGEAKKAHIHVLLLFPGKKSYNQIKSITDELCSPIPQTVSSAKGVVRYMLHLDNADKHQYNRSDLIGHGGVDVSEYLKITSSSRYEMIREMIQYIKDNSVVEMSDLMEYAMVERFDDWFPLLCDNSAYIVSSVIKSYRHKVDQPKPRKVDYETGEILE